VVTGSHKPKIINRNSGNVLHGKAIIKSFVSAKAFLKQGFYKASAIPGSVLGT